MGGGEMVAVMKELKTVMEKEKRQWDGTSSSILYRSNRMGEDFNQLGTALKENG